MKEPCIRATLTSLEIGEVVMFDVAETFPNPVRQIASDLKSKGLGCYKVFQNSITKEVSVRRIA